MKKLTLRCYAELNDHLPAGWRQRQFSYGLAGTVKVVDLLKALRIPTGQVELVLVDGRSVGLDHRLHGGERVSLFPMFEALDTSCLLAIRAQPLRQVRFLADTHLGRLARYLRLLGFDTLFENEKDPGDAALVRVAASEGRILLTRDRALLARRALTHGLWLPSTTAREQIVYLIDRLDLRGLCRPFTRCTRCNGPLKVVSKAELCDELPPRVKQTFQSFWQCEGCDRVYWRGTHYEHMQAVVAELLQERTRG